MTADVCVRMTTALSFWHFRPYKRRTLLVIERLWISFKISFTHILMMTMMMMWKIFPFINRACRLHTIYFKNQIEYWSSKLNAATKLLISVLFQRPSFLKFRLAEHRLSKTCHKYIFFIWCPPWSQSCSPKYGAIMFPLPRITRLALFSSNYIIK